MDGIKLVLFAVMCSADSLSCIEVPTSHYVFETPDQCEQQLQKTVLSLRNTHVFYTTPMARCRYLLIEKRARPTIEWQGASAGPEQGFRLTGQAGIAAPKADRLTAIACGGGELPATCPAGAGDRGPQRPPTVTVELPAGRDASTLVRLPAEQMAVRP